MKDMQLSGAESFSVQGTLTQVQIGGQNLRPDQTTMLVLALRRHFVELSAAINDGDGMRSVFSGRGRSFNIVERRRLFNIIERLDGIFVNDPRPDQYVNAVRFDDECLSEAETQQIYDALMWYRDHWLGTQVSVHFSSRAVDEMLDMFD